ncbi:agamous-like MADS-box protein AGL80 [Curcuma longa]|uniref:agamous-like MADS-box protein AGL80 n=1 Tax=Curcuma longa TaxID=136217 RepID=UPI003D9EFAAE
MARNKVKLAWIANDANRRSTLKKRRKGLMKKVRELSILCGVEACMVVYDPQEPHHPAAWPSNGEATRMLTRFKALSDIERSRKMTNQETYLKSRVNKLAEQFRRLQRQNREMQMTALLFEGLRGRPLYDLSIEDASALASTVDNKLQEVRERRQELIKSHGHNPMAAAAQPLPPSPPLPPPPPPSLLPTLPTSLMLQPPQQRFMWPFQEELNPFLQPVDADGGGHLLMAMAGGDHGALTHCGLAHPSLDPTAWDME